MIVTHAIANLIREGKTHQIYSAIETGAKLGMCTSRDLTGRTRQGAIDLHRGCLQQGEQPGYPEAETIGPGSEPRN
ncbi:MAG: hypothetical protein MZV70_00680 [Desulfobacterales bacterium]|nr:hypothetical protein [Desulfobacterales bacterium]